MFRRFLHSDPDPAVVFLKKVGLMGIAVCAAFWAIAAWMILF